MRGSRAYCPGPFFVGVQHMGRDGRSLLDYLPMVEWLGEMLLHARGHARRSTALSPLLWLLATLLGGVGVSSATDGPEWLDDALAVAALACFLLIIGFYWYWSLKDPNKLRSERFELSHTAMNLYGDDITGVVPRTVLPPGAESRSRIETGDKDE